MKNKIIQRLNSGWKFKEKGSEDWLKATVPGCVHLDLLDNNQIPGASETLERHLDFIPFTSFGFSQNNQLANNYIDLQTYLKDNFNVPLNIKLSIDKTIDELEYDVDPHYGGDNTWAEFILDLRGLYTDDISESNSLIIIFINTLRINIETNTDYNELEIEQFIHIFLSHII